MSSQDFHRKVDEQDRKHCLLDLHGVGGSNKARTAFVTKWRDTIEGLLRRPVEHEDEDLENAVADAGEWGEEAAALKANIESALDELKADPVKQKNVIEAKRLLTEALSTE